MESQGCRFCRIYDLDRDCNNCCYDPREDRVPLYTMQWARSPVGPVPVAGRPSKGGPR